jgi:hypothetical protein
VEHRSLELGSEPGLPLAHPLDSPLFPQPQPVEKLPGRHLFALDRRQRGGVDQQDALEVLVVERWSRGNCYAVSRLAENLGEGMDRPPVRVLAGLDRIGQGEERDRRRHGRPLKEV